jgi:aldose 1-epimerase
MAGENERTGGASTGDAPTHGGPYSAAAAVDHDLGSTVVALSYRDDRDPAGSIAVGIAPDLGSNMFRFRVGERDLIYTEPDLLRRMDFTGAFVLWPLPNRVRDKRYTYRGRTYSLADVPRPQGNDALIHGLVFDRPWRHDPPVATAESASVTTYIDITPESPHYDAYPFASRLALEYTLTRDGVTIAYSVHNKGAEELPYGFALHPYFATLAGKGDTLVRIPAREVMEADDELLPTGRVLPVDGLMYAPFDLRAPLPVGQLKLDHVYTALQPGEDAMIDYRAKEGAQGLRLRLSTSDDFTHMVIYTLGDGPSLCLENQTCSTDAVNLHDQGLQEIAHLLEVPPGGTRGGFIRYTVERLE